MKLAKEGLSFCTSFSRDFVGSPCLSTSAFTLKTVASSYPHLFFQHFLPEKLLSYRFNNLQDAECIEPQHLMMQKLIQIILESMLWLRVKKIKLKRSSFHQFITEAEVDPSAKSMSILILDLYDSCAEHSFGANQAWTTYDETLVLCFCSGYDTCKTI